MKQEIQLYINGQRADLFNDETIQVTSSIQNVKDIAKVFTDYSQTFTLPASQANNKIFQHYYNSDVVGGFDARFKVDAVIEINYQPFRTGKIKLEGVDLKDNAPYAYKVTFFGDIVNLKDLLGEDQLDGLNWLSNFDTIHSYDNVKAYLQNGRDFTIDSVSYPDAIIAPLISAEQRWYYDTATNISGSGNLQTVDSGLRGAYYKDFKYAIRVYCILKAIEKKYTIANGYPVNIVFSTDFFSTSETDFYGLYMWLHREKGRFGLSGTRNTYLSTINPESWEGVVMGTNNFSIFDIFSFSGTLYYEFTLNLNVSTSGANFNVYLERDGSVVESKLANTGSTSYALSFANLTQNGNYKIRIEHTTGFNVISTSTIDMVANFSGGSPESKTFTFTANQTISTDDNFIITSNIPQMKVIDFLTGLFKMFNLTAYEREGQIVVKPLSDFYASGISFDITEYVDMSQSSVSSSTLFKQINFQYAGLGSLFAVKHKELFNLDWATEEYALEDKFDGDVYDVTAPFEHHKFERLYNDATGASTTIQWGWSVDKLNDDGTGSNYLGLPLLFYAPLSGSTSIRLRNDASFDSVTSYYVPSNSVSLSSSNTINYKAELNEYTNTVFNDTLFSNYYSDYISDVFNAQTRITKVTAYLPIKILTQYKPEDTFIVGDRAYKINSITSDLTNGKSEIELINIL